ncbi:hypothetical protein F4804DRAFT_132984 [Jackrogersella minutella]|nr:hypothetical protein F4804DRAFT_132984 [Jackrogersella minutella]
MSGDSCAGGSKNPFLNHQARERPETHVNNAQRRFTSLRQSGQTSSELSDSATRDFAMFQQSQQQHLNLPIIAEQSQRPTRFNTGHPGPSWVDPQTAPLPSNTIISDPFHKEWLRNWPYSKQSRPVPEPQAKPLQRPDYRAEQSVNPFQVYQQPRPALTYPQINGYVPANLQAPVNNLNFQEPRDKQGYSSDPAVEFDQAYQHWLSELSALEQEVNTSSYDSETIADHLNQRDSFTESLVHADFVEERVEQPVRRFAEKRVEEPVAETVVEEAVEEAVAETVAEEAVEEPKQTDDQELAVAAQQILESVSDNESEKFRKSEFLDLMRRIAAMDLVVRDNALVESKPSAAGSASNAPEGVAAPETAPAAPVESSAGSRTQTSRVFPKPASVEDVV